MTTIQISSELQKELSKKKLYDKETYDEIIWDILEDTQELNEATKKELELSRTQAKEGKVLTLEEMKKKYGFR